MNLIYINQSQTRIPRRFLQEAAGLLKRELKKSGIGGNGLNQDLVLVFLPRAKAKKLNREFRNKDYATDVLSFGSQDPEVLGELVFCPEVLQKQALDNAHSYRWELLYMLIHGTLHLLGFDHEKSSGEARRMFRLQDRIFDRIRRVY